MANIYGTSPHKALKAWVLYDGNNRAVPGTPRLSRTKPRNGNWIEIPMGTCCYTTTNNPD